MEDLGGDFELTLIVKVKGAGKERHKRQLAEAIETSLRRITGDDTIEVMMVEPDVVAVFEHSWSIWNESRQPSHSPHLES